MRDGRKSRERLLLPLLLIGAALGALFLTLRSEDEVARERVRYEDLATARMHRLLEAQKAYHEAHGRYGWVEDLEKAGLLDGLVLASRDGLREVTSPRYRIDVLLPVVMAPGELVKIAPRGETEPHEELVKQHFAIVARPWSESVTGFRTFYTDNTGLFLVSEGVSDVPSRTRRPLPDLLLTRGWPRDVAGLRWWRLDQLPPQ
jgi:hypothetical protein